MAVLDCPHCGLEINDQLLRCPKCDKPTPKARRINQVYEKVEKQRRITNTMWLIFYLALAAVLFWFFFNSVYLFVPGGAPPPAPAAPPP